MNKEQQLKLQAFLDGELPEHEECEILAWTQRDAAAAVLLAELKSTRQAMVKSEPHLKVPGSREFFWSKIEREILRLEPSAVVAPQTLFFSTLRRLILPAGALAAVVIAGLVMHLGAPKAAVENADDDTPTVETALADSDATTYRDDSEGTTLVWFSPTVDDGPANLKAPATVN